MPQQHPRARRAKSREHRAPSNKLDNVLGAPNRHRSLNTAKTEEQERLASARQRANKKGREKARRRRTRLESNNRNDDEWDEARLLALNDGVVDGTRAAGLYGGRKTERLKASMQLSTAQYDRIRMSFEKFDPDKTGHIDRERLGLIMEDLGKKPESEEEINGLFRVTDKDASGLIAFDEFVSMMVLRVGFRATPGIRVGLRVMVLEHQPWAMFRQKRKQSAADPTRKTYAGPTVQFKMGANAQTLKPAIKLSSKADGGKHTRTRISADAANAVNRARAIEYSADVFIECDDPATLPIRIEAIGPAKKFRADGRMLKDLLACGEIDVAKLTDVDESRDVKLYVPKPMNMDQAPLRRVSDLSDLSDSETGLMDGLLEVKNNRANGAVSARKRRLKKLQRVVSENDAEIPVTDELYATLEIKVKRFLKEAKDMVENSVRPGAGLIHDPDVDQMLYDELETKLKDIIQADLENKHKNRMGLVRLDGDETKRASRTGLAPETEIEEWWFELDFQNMWIVSLHRLDEFIKHRFPVIWNIHALKLAWRSTYYPDFSPGSEREVSVLVNYRRRVECNGYAFISLHATCTRPI